MTAPIVTPWGPIGAPSNVIPLHRGIRPLRGSEIASCKGEPREVVDLYRAYELGAMPQEEWRQVPSFGDYIVSSEGRVRHRRVNAPILKGSLDKDGYHQVFLSGRTLRVHAIVCETFHGPRPKGMQCAHLDGDKRNNSARNLKWATPAENNSHKKLQGRPNGGHREFWRLRRVLPPETVEQIKSSPLSSRGAAKSFGVSQSYVVRLRNGLRREGNPA
jgi:hypothetical protein